MPISNTDFYFIAPKALKLPFSFSVKILVNSDGVIVLTERLLTEHLIEDVGGLVSIEDWANDLFPTSNKSIDEFLAKNREQIENDSVRGEPEFFQAFKVSEKDISAIKNFFAFPLKNSTHPSAILFSHSSFFIFLAEQIFGYAIDKQRKEANGKKPQLISTREVFERLIFLRMKVIYAPAEKISRSALSDWIYGVCRK